jgi:hypothetical protein
MVTPPRFHEVELDGRRYVGLEAVGLDLYFYVTT